MMYVHVCPVLGSPDLDTVLQVWLHQGWVEEKGNLPQLAGNSPLNPVQDKINHKISSKIKISP